MPAFKFNPIAMRSGFLIFYLLALVCFGSFASPLKRATPADIETLINRLTDEANAAASDLADFPATGGSLTQALAIHSALTTLNSDLESGVTTLVATATGLSEADGVVVVDEANNGLTPALLDIYTGINNFPDETLPIGGIGALLRSDGNKLQSDSTAFYNALKALLPSDLEGSLRFPNPPIVQPGDPNS
ncbi:hypothetical protein D9756_009513 [Leucocoprinus leucothites]|uniref:Uncharacterized protein n=1 Tax=Leucocoprinus leucothites TaxID=201217 RepID=A0A8H5CW27_9AGAR|nr:hypothetical protein D9756_009513 [Leucoagaricus leucothites]